MTTHRTTALYQPPPGSPAPLRASIRRRVQFSEVDPMGIVWFGRYALCFEEAAAELGRQIGLGYADYYQAGLRAPVARYEVDYRQPLRLDDTITVTAELLWNEAARLDTQFTITLDSGTIAATARLTQLLTDAATGTLCLASPDLLIALRQRWNSIKTLDPQCPPGGTGAR